MSDPISLFDCVCVCCKFHRNVALILLMIHIYTFATTPINFTQMKASGKSYMDHSVFKFN